MDTLAIIFFLAILYMAATLIFQNLDFHKFKNHREKK